jgi:hypothetical protein
MSINNFDQITGMMDFSIPNTMYFIQILKRRKDNPEMPTGVKVIRNYYIHSVDDMSRLQPFIVQECNDNNARAYINPNRLNTVNISLNTLKVIVDEMLISLSLRVIDFLKYKKLLIQFQITLLVKQVYVELKRLTQQLVVIITQSHVKSGWLISTQRTVI